MYSALHEKATLSWSGLITLVEGIYPKLGSWLTQWRRR